MMSRRDAGYCNDHRSIVWSPAELHRKQSGALLSWHLRPENCDFDVIWIAADGVGAGHGGFVSPYWRT